MRYYTRLVSGELEMPIVGQRAARPSGALVAVVPRFALAVEGGLTNQAAFPLQILN
jgi:hypothetical protein